MCSASPPPVNTFQPANPLARRPQNGNPLARSQSPYTPPAAATTVPDAGPAARGSPTPGQPYAATTVTDSTPSIPSGSPAARSGTGTPTTIPDAGANPLARGTPTGTPSSDGSNPLARSGTPTPNTGNPAARTNPTGTPPPPTAASTGGAAPNRNTPAPTTTGGPTTFGTPANNFSGGGWGGQQTVRGVPRGSQRFEIDFTDPAYGGKQGGAWSVAAPRVGPGQWFNLVLKDANGNVVKRVDSGGAGNGMATISADGLPTNQKYYLDVDTNVDGYTIQRNGRDRAAVGGEVDPDWLRTYGGGGGGPVNTGRGIPPDGITPDPPPTGGPNIVPEPPAPPPPTLTPPTAPAPPPAPVPQTGGIDHWPVPITGGIDPRPYQPISRSSSIEGLPAGAIVDALLRKYKRNIWD
jgi:hypothetical protein